MRRLATLLGLSLLVTACAAASKSGAPPTSPSPGGGAADAPASMSQPQAYPTGGAPPPPPAPGASTGKTSDGTPHGRDLERVASDIEASQRELDVAAGDCRNACRALGSMDRAAGALCGLTHSDETRRCDDAKQRVYTARDRVKATCGQCEGGPSVERTAPVPSLR